MEFFKSNTKINFMGQRMIAAIISGVLFIACIISLITQGLNLGLDFTGGTQIEVVFNQPVDSTEIREKLHQNGFTQAIVQPYGPKDISIRIAPRKDMTQDQIKAQLQSLLPDGKIGSLEYIGPQVGKQLVTNGILAVVLALIFTMIYVAFRFEIRFAISAAVALIHDPILILGIFSFFHLEFDMIVLTAVLTVIGYSLNDTIVVYDRVRENFRKVRKATPLEIMNLSINQTLSRTIMTSGMTLLVVIALLIYGGEVIHGFALALVIGIVVGTYSSIYIAGSIAIALGLDRSSLLPAVVKKEDGLP